MDAVADVELVVVYNAAMEPAHTAALRERRRAHHAESLRQAAIALGMPDPATRPPVAPPPSLDMVALLGGAQAAIVARVLRDAHPQAFTNRDLWRAIVGEGVPYNSTKMTSLARARLALEAIGRVRRVGYASAPAGTGRNLVRFRWVSDEEYVAPPPRTITPGPRSLAGMVAKIRAELARVYPAALSGEELLAAIAPDCRGDDALLRTIGKARLDLEHTGHIERHPSAGGAWPIRVRLSRREAANEGRATCDV